MAGSSQILASRPLRTKRADPEEVCRSFVQQCTEAGAHRMSLAPEIWLRTTPAIAGQPRLRAGTRSWTKVPSPSLRLFSFPHPAVFARLPCRRPITFTARLSDVPYNPPGDRRHGQTEKEAQIHPPPLKTPRPQNPAGQTPLLPQRPQTRPLLPHPPRPLRRLPSPL